LCLPQGHTRHTRKLAGVQRNHIHPQRPRLSPGHPGVLHAALLRRTGCGPLSISPRSRFVLRRTFCLYMFGHKPAIGAEVALHQGLRLVFKRVRQRIAAGVTYRKGFAFAFQDEIHTPGKAPDAAHGNGAANTHALRPLRTLQRLQFYNRVVVGLALAIAEPGQESQRRHDDPHPQTKFSLFFHDPCSLSIVLYHRQKCGLSPSSAAKYKVQNIAHGCTFVQVRPGLDSISRKRERLISSTEELQLKGFPPSETILHPTSTERTSWTIS